MKNAVLGEGDDQHIVYRTSLLALASSSDVDNGMLIALQTVAGLKPLREI